jgi:hypothetical protein
VNWKCLHNLTISWSDTYIYMIVMFLSILLQQRAAINQIQCKHLTDIHVHVYNILMFLSILLQQRAAINKIQCKHLTDIHVYNILMFLIISMQIIICSSKLKWIENVYIIWQLADQIHTYTCSKNNRWLYDAFNHDKIQNYWMDASMTSKHWHTEVIYLKNTETVGEPYKMS